MTHFRNACKLGIGPSFGHRTKCQWFGIKQYAQTRMGRTASQFDYLKEYLEEALDG